MSTKNDCELDRRLSVKNEKKKLVISLTSLHWLPLSSINDLFSVHFIDSNVVELYLCLKLKSNQKQ